MNVGVNWNCKLNFSFLDEHLSSKIDKKLKIIEYIHACQSYQIWLYYKQNDFFLTLKNNILKEHININATMQSTV